MPSPSGSFQIGPDTATLTVRTGTAGAMAKAGHSLVIEVGAWSAQLELADDPAAGSVSLDADSTSLTVISGSGGPKPLSDADKAKIAGIINDKVLRGSRITFTSTGVEPSEGSTWRIRGDLTLLGATGPVEFALTIGDDGRFSATTEIAQTAFGMEPYSAMMGALKVKDELVIGVDGHLPPPSDG
jgi:polyisoprenoid-binding protein YceI